jgi:hypothetical protein
MSAKYPVRTSLLVHFGVWRAVKGAAVTALTVWVCSGILVKGFDIVRKREGDTWGFDLTPLLALAISLVVMPIMLWAGMRLLREERNAPATAVRFQAASIRPAL